MGWSATDVSVALARTPRVGVTRTAAPRRPARTPRARAAGIRARRAGVRRCTTRRLNAHKTTERTVLYPWHPWTGLSVHVHEVTERGNVAALRCSLGGDVGRCLEVPAWMFEWSACVPLGIAPQPRVGVGALSALQRLLAEVPGHRPADALGSAAEGDSPDRNRGDVHAMPPRSSPGGAGEPGSAMRPVRPPSRGGPPGAGGLAGAARGDAAEPDRPDGAPAPRARGQRAARRRSP